MAIAEPTRAPAAAQSAPLTNLDLHQRLCDAEDDLWLAVDYVHAALMVIEGTGPIPESRRGAVVRLLGDATVNMERLADVWRTLFDATRGAPRDDGNGDVEESAGDIGGQS